MQVQDFPVKDQIFQNGTRVGWSSSNQMKRELINGEIVQVVLVCTVSNNFTSQPCWVDEEEDCKDDTLAAGFSSLYFTLFYFHIFIGGLCQEH